jgi:carbon storage regulator
MANPFPMLVLSRKTKQSIMIGDDVEITVLSIDAGKVRLGIQAPAEVSVHRTEIYLEIQEGGSRREPKAKDASSQERASRGEQPGS